jgi:Holliday junction resolvase-like predicted endonuclease
MITKEADSIGYVEVKTDKNEANKADSVNTNDINKIQAVGFILLTLWIVT